VDGVSAACVSRRSRRRALGTGASRAQRLDRAIARSGRGVDAIARLQGAAGRAVSAAVARAAARAGACGVSDTRSAILDRVRRAQATGRIPAAQPAGHHGPATHASPTRASDELNGVGFRPGDIHPPLRETAAPTRDRLLTIFLRELTALGVAHHVEVSAEDVRNRVRSIADGRAVLAWDRERLPYEVGAVLAGAATGASPRAEQAAAEVGVTGCDAAIAETGSLVVLSGPGKPRAASLLPPLHVCVVRLDDLRASMGEFFEERASDIASSASCTFITGPSRTADIELTLTLGVHGPGTVIVVVGP
jgi:L-lactate dehydrogenase complex protein LldG